MNHFLRILLATMMALAALAALLKITPSDRTLSPPSPTDETFVCYLPLIQRTITTSPAGTYDCYETEFSMIWKREVVTLNTDGGLIYEYYYPFHSSSITGTWVYTPSLDVIGFTNFTWPWVTFQPPDHLWNSQYITHTGSELTIGCNRLP